MNRKLAVHILLVATAVLSNAQEKAQDPGQPSQLYAAEGKTFLNGLEKNIYGSGETMKVEGSTYLFTPTTPDDHLATKFFPVQSAPGKFVKIMLDFVEPEPAGAELRVIVQDGSLSSLKEFRPHPNASNGLSFVYEAGLKDRSSSVRLLFMAGASKLAALPSRVRVESPVTPSQGLSPTWYVIFGIGGIAVLALIAMLVRKKSPA